MILNRGVHRLAWTLALCVAGAAAASQPDANPPAPEPRAESRPAENERLAPELIRQRIEARLRQSRQETEALEDALRRIDAGTAPASVMPDLRDRVAPAPPREDQRRFGPGARGRARGALGAEAREQTLELLREISPPMHERLTAVLRDRPLIGERMLGEVAGELRELQALRERDRERFETRAAELHAEWEMRHAAFEFARTRRELDRGGETPERARAVAAARSALEEAVGVRFDAALAAKRVELARLSGRLDALREELAASDRERNAQVAERTERMIARIERAAAWPDNERRGAAPRDDDAPPKP